MLQEKMTCFELGVRIPVNDRTAAQPPLALAHNHHVCALCSSAQFIIRAPWLPAAVGRVSNDLAEIIDLYKTLDELAGIPLPAHDSKAVQGTSLVQAMQGSGGNGTMYQYAFSQFAKSGSGGAWDGKQWGTCMDCFPTGQPAGTGGGAANFMGFSVRSSDWRYTEWIPYNRTGGFPEWASGAAATELYDHRTDHGDSFDDFENANMANDTSAVAAAARTELAAALRAQFEHDE